MGEDKKERLRALFAINKVETKPIQSPSQTLPIIKISEMDLSEDSMHFTYGYGDTGRFASNRTSGYGDKTSKVDRAGQVIDNKYRIIGPLGEGGASEVYLCERLLVGDRVALKMLRAQYASDMETSRRFHLEALTTASIKHPNVITIHDFDFTDDGIPFMVMELLRGNTLFDELKRAGRLQLRHCLRIIMPICSALNVAHLHGIIHRDLKPANIVLHRMDDGTEVMKLIDFGIAKQFLEPKANIVSTAPGMVVGTPAYMAPERCMEETYDERADIYNLGLILYEMIAGQHPFSARTMTAMMAKQISELPKPLTQIAPDVPAEIDRVVLKALAKSPNDRYSTALELADALNRFYYLI